MRGCLTCKNAIFNEQWGEWRCKLKERTVQLTEASKCTDYGRDKEKSRKKRTP